MLASGTMPSQDAQSRPSRPLSLLRWTRSHLGLLALAALVLFFATRALMPRILGHEVPVIRPERGTLVQTVVISGRVRAPAKIDLAPQVAATITALPVEEGDRVSAGQVLIELDNTEAQAAVAEAEARLAQARAQLRQILTVTSPQAAEAVRQAEARLSDATLRYQRTSRLLAQASATQEELDRTKIAQELAQSELRATEARARDTARGGAQASAAQAAVSQAEAALLAAQARLAKTRITAPAPGIVIARRLERGSLAQPGQIALIIAQDGASELVVEPDERNLALLAMGQPALASAEAFPDQSFPAQVSFIAPAVDARRGTIEVRLTVPEPPAYLRPDMTVSVEIEVNRKADALTLPADAIRGLATRTPWVLVAEGGLAVRRDVTTGMRGDSNVEITAGLGPDSMIIPAGERDLEPGMKVRPRPQALPSAGKAGNPQAGQGGT